MLVLAPVRAAAEEVARAACTERPARRAAPAFRELVLELAAAGTEPPRAGAGRAIRSRSAGRARHRRDAADLSRARSRPFPAFPRALTATFEELRLNGIRPAATARLRPVRARPREAPRGLRARARDAPLRRPRHARQTGAGRTRDLYQRRGRRARSRAAHAAWSANCSRRVMRSARATLDLRLAPAASRPRPRSNRCSATSSPAIPCRRAPRTAASRSSPLPARRWSASRSRGASAPPERPVRRDRDPAALAGAPSAAGRGSAAPRGHSGALHARARAARRRRPQLSRAAALRRRRARAHRASPSISRSARCARTRSRARRRVWERLLVDAAVIGGPERWETRLRGLREELHRRYRGGAATARARAPDRCARESARSSRCRSSSRLAALPGARHVGRVDRRPARTGRVHAARAGARRRSCWRNSSRWPTSVRSGSARCCWCSVRG